MSRFYVSPDGCIVILDAQDCAALAGPTAVLMAKAEGDRAQQFAAHPCACVRCGQVR